MNLGKFSFNSESNDLKKFENLELNDKKIVFYSENENSIFIFKSLIDELVNQNIAICYERLGQWDKAEKDFLTSLDIKPDSANVLNYLAYGWVEREIRLDQSLNMLEAAYKANPESYYIIDSFLSISI